MRLQPHDRAWSGFWYNNPVAGLPDCGATTVTGVVVTLPRLSRRFHLTFLATVCLGEGEVGEAEPVRDRRFR